MYPLTLAILPDHPAAESYKKFCQLCNKLPTIVSNLLKKSKQYDNVNMQKIVEVIEITEGKKACDYLKSY